MKRHTVDQASFIRQALEAERMMAELLELTEQEVTCWRMFGIRADWHMDCLLIEAP